MKPESFKPTPEIREFAQIMEPRQAEQPILSDAIRAAVRQWMVELSSGDELSAVGIKPRRSAMLSGPPGCGKTTLAHHFAARLGLPLVIVNMGSLVSCYLGETGRNINKMFDAIQQQGESCVLLLDEFDSIAGKRMDAERGAGRERNSIVIALLQKIDDFTGTMIAATNLDTHIDAAIWRRFGMHLNILEPDDECRFAILTRYLAPYRLPEEAMNILCEVTAGASPAVLRQLMEGVKRDMVLSPKYKQPMDALTVMKRTVVAVRPHADATLPPLWKEGWALELVAQMPWPPEKPE